MLFLILNMKSKSWLWTDKKML